MKRIKNHRIQMPPPPKNLSEHHPDGCGLIAYPTAELALFYAESKSLEAYECRRGWFHLRSTKNA